MNVTAPIKTLIAADTTANGIFAGRVYMTKLLQETAYPAAALQVIDTGPASTKTQVSDMDRVMLQIDVYATSYKAANDGAEAIRGAIDFQGSGDVQQVFFKTQNDGYSEKPELFRVISEYSVILRR